MCFERTRRARPPLGTSAALFSGEIEAPLTASEDPLTAIVRAVLQKADRAMYRQDRFRCLKLPKTQLRRG